MMKDRNYDAHIDLQADLNEILASVTTENILSALMAGAEEMAADARRLPRPRSKVYTAGYTHLVASVHAWKTKSNVKLGWGKYYGPMVENGTASMNSQAHLEPLWNRNKTKYQSKMIDSLKLGG